MINLILSRYCTCDCEKNGMVGIPKGLLVLFPEYHWSIGIHFCRYIMHRYCYMVYKKGIFTM